MTSHNTPFRLSADQVSFQYPQNSYGITPVSLNAQPGEFIHIAGDSGCGKSTLARCLTGIIPHLYHGTFSGEVSIAGLRTTQHPLWQIAEHTSLVFQNPAMQMMSASVEDEIVFGLENLGLDRTQIRHQLDTTLARFRLETLRARTPQTLSGGEQQKVALAAIAARQPEVLVLDEPLSMLDVTAAADFVRYLTNLADSGTTVIMLEHRAEYLTAVTGLRRITLNGQFQDRTAPQSRDLPFEHTTPSFTVQITGLTARLGRRTVLDHLTFDLHGGETVAIVGRNGTGKTTLLRALTGLQPYDGTITLDGESQTIHPDFGMVYQNADLQLFTASVRDEILYGVAQPDRQLYTTLLDQLGLARYENMPPLLLSEGEKKRVALATVLIRQPQHGLLLDEPSLGQDGHHKHMLVQLARSLNDAGRLVIMTTHDLALAAHADRLILLDEHGIIANGPPQHVFQDAQAWAQSGLCVPAWIANPIASYPTRVPAYATTQ